MTVNAAELIRSIYADVALGDLAAVAARLAPDFVADQNVILPFGGRWNGREGFADMATQILRAFPDFSVEPLAFYECGPSVLVETRVTAVGRPEKMPLNQPMHEYWEVKDGEAIICRPFYSDPQAAAESAISLGEK